MVYEKNKDTMPGLLISQGGVVASGIQFDSEDAAKDLQHRLPIMIELLENYLVELNRHFP